MLSPGVINHPQGLTQFRALTQPPLGLLQDGPGGIGGAKLPLQCRQSQVGLWALSEALGEVPPEGFRLAEVFAGLEAQREALPDAPVLRILLKDLLAEALDPLPVLIAFGVLEVE